MEFWPNLPYESKVLVCVYLGLMLTTIYLFVRKSKWLGLFLFLSTFILASAFAFITPYFFMWDEMFHAMVGKNLTADPFHPKLMNFSPWLFENSNWAQQYTWLHKPPLFLYQIALSIKAFGNTVYAVRFPSVLLFSFTVWAMFDLGKRLEGIKFGFIAALILMHSSFPLGMLSGRIGTDHNDLVFMCYVFFSFYAYTRFRIENTFKWVFITGLMVGLAVLTKWLTGLLVFLPWGICALTCLLRGESWAEFKQLGKALLVAILTFVPWQIYIFTFFPKRALQEFEYNHLHFTIPVEGHVEEWYYYFDNVKVLFSTHFIFVLFLIIFLIALFRKSKNRYLFLHYLGAIVGLYLFFTIAATKMFSFVSPAYPLIVFCFVYGLVQVSSFVKKKHFGNIVLFGLASWLLVASFRPNKTARLYGLENNTIEKVHRQILMGQMDLILKHCDENSNKLVMNSFLRGNGNIPWMYFSKNKALAFIPSEQDLSRLKKEGYELVCLEWNDPLPEYILQDSSIRILKVED